MVDHMRLMLLLTVLFCSLPLSAHGLKVYAEVEGESIHGHVHFAGGAAAGSVQISITGADGEVLDVLKPDPDGHFTYRIKSPADLVVVADSLDGHQASWSVKAEAFTALPPAGADPVAGVTCAEALAAKTGPLREALTACEERQRLRDILGGLGYIVGLAGLGLWWGGRRQRRV